MRKPWGVVALGGFVYVFIEINMGGMVEALTRNPLTVIALSYVVGGLVSMIPVKGDQAAAVGHAAASRT
jgi:hypothetical protein